MVFVIFFRKLTIFLEIVIHHKERGWSIVTNLNKKKSTRFSSRTQTHLLTDSNSFLDKPTTIFVSIFNEIEIFFHQNRKIFTEKNLNSKIFQKQKFSNSKFFSSKMAASFFFCKIEIKRILSRDLIIFSWKVMFCETFYGLWSVRNLT